MRFERAALQSGHRLIAGVDEAGRGALFGPVFAAAVILDPDSPIRGLNDSKLLDPDRREILAARIRQRAVSWAVAASDAFEIDRVNILEASRAAMRRAVERLLPQPDFLLVDYVTVPGGWPQRGIVHGDAASRSIAAASILAKVERDRCLAQWDAVYPGYGLASHKGYTAPQHLDALARMGPTPHHRFSFLPVREASPLPVWRGYAGPLQTELFAEATA